MIKFTEKTLIIEIEDTSPVEYLLNLQNAINDIVAQKMFIESQTDILDSLVLSSADSLAWYRLLNFFRDISFSYETNEKLYDKICKVLDPKPIKTFNNQANTQ